MQSRLDIELLRSLDRYQVRNGFIIVELCHQRVIDFRNTQNFRDSCDYLFARTFEGKVYFWEFCKTKP